ncbi:MAG: hypothetical protein HKL85_09565 [Acidimicrobiaceae bacterium]|nr:hypothetical protein [Acidimicrobiaceae bacterium]
MKHSMTKVAALVFAITPVAATALASGVAGAAAPSHVTEHMRLITGKMAHKSGWPKITNSSWTVHKGETVTVQIVSYDDGTAPLMGQYMKYANVMGTTNGKELVNGLSVSNVSDINIAHTFTIAKLGFNMPIPVAPTGKSIVVTATFKATKTGTFVWNCFAPCGSSPAGMGGAMKGMDWMTGKVKVAQ